MRVRQEAYFYPLPTPPQNEPIKIPPKLGDSNEIWTHNHLVCKRTLSLAKWFSVLLRTKCLWVQNSLLSLKLQIWHLLRARSSLTFRQTIEFRFTLKLVRDMITYNQIIFDMMIIIWNKTNTILSLLNFKVFCVYFSSCVQMEQNLLA